MRNLLLQLPKRQKNEGVRQFILLSSMSVYGLTTGHILKSTQPRPTTNYGKAKYNADMKIIKLEDSLFKVAILRPPMVYGNGCKGNYQTLRKFALKMPIFPSIRNHRSMIYINNLAEFVRNLIDNQDSGLFFPQDDEYINTNELVKKIAEYNNKKIRIIGIFNPIIKLGIACGVGTLKKVFGNLTYEKSDCIKGLGFEDRIKETETFILKEVHK